MNTKANERIKELHERKVVRIFKNNNYYKISAMDTMAAIVMNPEPASDDTSFVQNITLTGHCTIYEAELLIEQLSN